MKKLMVVATLVLALASLGVAGDAKITGYLVDKMCGAKPERAASHTKSCTEKCAGSGLGVVADGKFISFDEKGNQLAADLLKNSKATKGVKVEVQGTQDGETLKVASIKEAAAE